MLDQELVEGEELLPDRSEDIMKGGGNSHQRACRGLVSWE